MIAFALLVIASLLVGLKRPTLLVVFYILAHTKLLGFLSLDEAVLVSGFAAGNLALNIACLAAAAFWIARNPKVESYHFFFIFAYLAFFVYGVARALLIDTDLGLYAIVEGKHFLVVFFLSFLVAASRRINREKIIRLLVWVGIYLSLVIVLYQLTGLSPPAYLTTNYQGEYQRVAHPTYIALSFLIVLARQPIGLLSRLPLLLLLLFGLLGTGHFSIFISTLVFGLVFIFLFRGTAQRRVKLVALWAYVVCVGSGLAATIKINLLATIGAVLGLSRSDIDGSILGRIAQNSERWSQVYDAPLFGKGFLHGSSRTLSGSFGVSENRFMSTFSVVDAGYLNLFLFFGFIGTALYFLMWFWVAKVVLLNSSNKFAWAMILFLCAMLVTNITWAPFSFDFGLVPLIISVWLVDKSRKSSVRL